MSDSCFHLFFLDSFLYSSPSILHYVARKNRRFYFENFVNIFLRYTFLREQKGFVAVKKEKHFYEKIKYVNNNTT